jgi:hypothetical protein
MFLANVWPLSKPCSRLADRRDEKIAGNVWQVMLIKISVTETRKILGK